MISLWHVMGAAGHLAERELRGVGGRAALADLAGSTSLGGRLEELRGRAVLLAVRDQLTAALALIELDGVASRLVVCPPDLPAEHLPFVMATAAVEAVVGDRTPGLGIVDVECTATLAPLTTPRAATVLTEWILLTSGTTGPPKLVAHTLASLTAPITRGSAPTASAVWSTFYDIRRYGGLQIFLRAMLGWGSMVLSSAAEPTGDFLLRAAADGVTHISGTPSHWRRALMSPSAPKLAPRYVRLSGEIADQAVLDRLRDVYPGAGLGHAFASTEAGVAFEVDDGLAGFPSARIGQPGPVELKVVDGSLRIRSPRTAARYLGAEAPALRDGDGFVDTGDMVERRGDRYYFVGRRDGMINVGGLKVHPEEVEAVINGHPHVRMSRVRTRKSPITGALVIADVVLNGEPPAPGPTRTELERDITERCRAVLARHKVPAAINVVPALPVTAGGKLVRHGA